MQTLRMQTHSVQSRSSRRVVGSAPGIQVHRRSWPAGILWGLVNEGGVVHSAVDNKREASPHIRVTRGLGYGLPPSPVSPHMSKGGVHYLSRNSYVPGTGRCWTHGTSSSLTTTLSHRHLHFSDETQRGDTCPVSGGCEDPSTVSLHPRP